MVRMLWINPVGTDAYDAPIGAELRAEAAPTTRVDVCSLPGAGPQHLEWNALEAVVAGPTMGVVRWASEQQSYDAAVIGCFYDPFLRGARELAGPMAVTAPAEACLHIAATIGERVSILVGRRKWIPEMHENVVTRIEIWGRRPDAAEAVAEQLRAEGFPARATTDLDTGVQTADIISCVTGATSPLVRGDLLAPGSHLDLVGSFQPDMRESDDAAASRATIFVDTAAGALLSGDLAQPLADGVITESSIAADLRALATGDHPGRTSADEITLFKSAGFAAADLAAARLALR